MQCARCSKTAQYKCNACRGTPYCSRECQKTHWNTHKKECNGKKGGSVRPNEGVASRTTRNNTTAEGIGDEGKKCCKCGDGAVGGAGRVCARNFNLGRKFSGLLLCEGCALEFMGALMQLGVININPKSPQLMINGSEPVTAPLEVLFVQDGVVVKETVDRQVILKQFLHYVMMAEPAKNFMLSLLVNRLLVNVGEDASHTGVPAYHTMTEGPISFMLADAKELCRQAQGGEVDYFRDADGPVRYTVDVGSRIQYDMAYVLIRADHCQQPRSTWLLHGLTNTVLDPSGILCSYAVLVPRGHRLPELENKVLTVQDVDCSVCLDATDNKMSCGHLLCEACAQKIRAHGSSDDVLDNGVKCPVCNREDVVSVHNRLK